MLIHGLISLSQLGQERHSRLTSVVLDIINSHVGGNKGSFAVFLFVLLFCQQLGLGLFSRDDVFYFCTRRKKNSVIVRKGSRHRNGKCMDLEDSNSTAVAPDAVFERGGRAMETDTLFQR